MRAAVIIIAITIVAASEPGSVFRITRDPFAGACDSRAFRADQALAVDMGIGEKERVATFDGGLF